MFKLFLIIVVLILSSVQCDITSLNDFFSILKRSNSSIPMGFLTKANVDVAKRYLRNNIIVKMFDHKIDMLQALDNETIHGMK
jgi:hypothetical protein